MCVVIDTNRAADFCQQQKPYLKVLMCWIKNGGKVASAGKLEAELLKVARMATLLVQWSSAGRLIKISSERVNQREQSITDICVSNDAHIVALVIEANAKIIVTEDKNLIKDLKNSDLVRTRPRIYKENTSNPQNVQRHRSMLNRLNCS